MALTIVCQSQTVENPKYEFTYYSTINKQILEEYECKLYFNEASSVFLWSKIGDDELKSDGMGNLTRAEHRRDGCFNYLNSIENELISKEVISFEEFHYVEQEIPKIDWKITTLKRDIAGYECTLAEGVYGDRKYNAWFTESIPTKFGPWKLQGLPGLILRVADEAKEFSFSLTGIKKCSEPEITITDEIEKLVTLEHYYQRKVDYPFDYVRKVMAKAEKGSSLKITNVNYNFIEKNYERLGREEFRK